MPLVPKVVATDLYNFIQQQNATEVENKDLAIQQFCDKIEQLIYQSIKNATIQIPPGFVIVVAPPPTGVGSNPAPIVLPPGSIT